MFIDSLSVMENIVDSNSNLYWEGWDVVEIKSFGSQAALNKNARFVNGKWAKVKVYSPDQRGWKVPETWQI